MNAVIAPTKKATAKRATAAPAPAPLTTAPDPVGAAFRQISVHLRNAAYAEADGGLQSGHSTRLLRTAASMAGALGGQWWGMSSGQNEGYDIAALVIAALHVEKDDLDFYALDEIGAANALLGELTEDDNVLEGALLSNASARDGVQLLHPTAALDPLIHDLLADLESLSAQVEFAFEGRSEGDTGSTENGLLSMAADHMNSIIENVRDGTYLGPADMDRGQLELLFQLGRFEHLIEGVVSVIADRYPESHREQARRTHILQVLSYSAQVYNDCDTGKWAEAILNAKKEAADAA